MIKDFVLNLLNIIVGHVHIRMILSEFFIYPDRIAFVVLNLDVMFEIRLPLLISF